MAFHRNPDTLGFKLRRGFVDLAYQTGFFRGRQKPRLPLVDFHPKRIKKKGMTGLESLEWYLDLRRFGTVTHSGFGLGFDRALMYITGIANIRDIQLFPRVPRWGRF